MTLQQFTTKLQAMCHEGHSMQKVAVNVGNIRYAVQNMECIPDKDVIEINVFDAEVRT